MDQDKKKKAAVAGVMYYLQEEKERSSATIDRELTNQPTNWSAYSRQMTMINRDRFQRRIVKR
ncbi:MAG: hypothetical protein K0B81_01830 [Candidatus Cloacimonetes bacterium]|nr:hypothetical protein [Candidatus Cloacimonadota bacterium]